MKHLISERMALATIATILSLMIVFHVLVLAGVIPFAMVWGGRITDRAQMLRLETISVMVNLLLLAVVGVRAGLLGRRLPQGIITIVLWIMSGLFFLNTIGNLLSLNGLERLLFTPLTLLLSLLCLRLALSRDTRKLAQPG